MSINITKRNYLWQSALLTLVMGGIGGLLFFYCFPRHYFGGYPLIPVFFFVLGIFTISMTEVCRKHLPQRLSQVYMVMRGIRMLFSIIVMAVYCVVVHEEVKAFVLTFIANYLIYMIYDSWFFYLFELNRKKKTNNETKA